MTHETNREIVAENSIIDDDKVLMNNILNAPMARIREYFGKPKLHVEINREIKADEKLVIITPRKRFGFKSPDQLKATIEASGKSQSVNSI